MEFQVTFLRIRKTNLPNAFIETSLENRTMTLQEIESYLQNFSPNLRRLPSQHLRPFHAESLRLINRGIRLLNTIWEKSIYPRLEAEPERAGILDLRFADLQIEVFEQNQFTMLLDCLRPYQRRIARRRG